MGGVDKSHGLLRIILKYILRLSLILNARNPKNQEISP